MEVEDCEEAEYYKEYWHFWTLVLEKTHENTIDSQENTWLFNPEF